MFMNMHSHFENATIQYQIVLNVNENKIYIFKELEQILGENPHIIYHFVIVLQLENTLYSIDFMQTKMYKIINNCLGC